MFSIYLLMWIGTFQSKTLTVNIQQRVSFGDQTGTVSCILKLLWTEKSNQVCISELNLKREEFCYLNLFYNKGLVLKHLHKPNVITKKICEQNL